MAPFKKQATEGTAPAAKKKRSSELASDFGLGDRVLGYGVGGVPYRSGYFSRRNIVTINGYLLVTSSIIEGDNGAPVFRVSCDGEEPFFVDNACPLQSWVKLMEALQVLLPENKREDWHLKDMRWALERYRLDKYDNDLRNLALQDERSLAWSHVSMEALLQACPEFNAAFMSLRNEMIDAQKTPPPPQSPVELKLTEWLQTMLKRLGPSGLEHRKKRPLSMYPSRFKYTVDELVDGEMSFYPCDIRNLAGFLAQVEYLERSRQDRRRYVSKEKNGKNVDVWEDEPEPADVLEMDALRAELEGIGYDVHDWLKQGGAKSMQELQQNLLDAGLQDYLGYSNPKYQQLRNIFSDKGVGPVSSAVQGRAFLATLFDKYTRPVLCAGQVVGYAVSPTFALQVCARRADLYGLKENVVNEVKVTGDGANIAGDNNLLAICLTFPDATSKQQSAHKVTCSHFFLKFHVFFEVILFYF
jgi:hypothetical protein